MLATGEITVSGQKVQIWAGTKQPSATGTLLFYWHGTGGNSGEAMATMGTQINEIVAAGGIVASFSTSTKQGDTVNNNVWYTGDFQMTDIIAACAIQQLNIDRHRIYSAGCSAGGIMSSAMAYYRSSYLAAAMPNSGVITRLFTLQNTHVPPVQWTFCKAHPFGVSPEPYSPTLPSAFPSYCSIISGDAGAGAPNNFTCGAAALCMGANVCCYQFGDGGSTIMGQSSACVAPGAQNGSAGRCPKGQLQLCATAADCSGGMSSTGGTGGYRI